MPKIDGMSRMTSPFSYQPSPYHLKFDRQEYININYVGDVLKENLF